MKKVTDLRNINELFSEINPLAVENLVTDPSNSEVLEEEGEEKNYKTIATTSLVTVISYMLGMDEDKLQMHYGEYNEDLIKSLQSNKEATIIRYLCRLRTALLLNFMNTDNEIRFNLGNIDRLSWFHVDEITKLRNWGIEVVHTNYRADKYSESFCELIADHIDACRGLFPDWLNYEYIRDLFVVPKFKKTEVMKEEYVKYKANINSYPFQLYIHWNPGDYGNILYCDGKFLNILYEQHGDVFNDRSKYRDAVEDTKRSIYDYIDLCNRVMIVVDCENSDVYKLHAVLKNLDSDEIAKIEKIVLYDDSHTTAGWDWLE